MLARRTLAVGALLGMLLPGLARGAGQAAENRCADRHEWPVRHPGRREFRRGGADGGRGCGGTLAGRKIEVVFGDTLNKADVAANLARRVVRRRRRRCPGRRAGVLGGACRSGRRQGKEEGGAVLQRPTDRLSNEDCAPYSVQWMLDTNVLARGTVRSILENGGDPGSS